MDDNGVKFEEDFGYRRPSYARAGETREGLADWTVRASGGILNSHNKVFYFWLAVSFIFFAVSYSVVRNTFLNNKLVNGDALRELSPPEAYAIYKR